MNRSEQHRARLRAQLIEAERRGDTVRARRLYEAIFASAKAEARVGV